MKKNEWNYELVTADKYEQVLASADTMEGLSKLIHIKRITLAQALERKSLIAGRYRVVRVNSRDLDFDFEDYNEFCKTENIKPGHASSIQRFKEYIGGDYDCGL